MSTPLILAIAIEAVAVPYLILNIFAGRYWQKVEAMVWQDIDRAEDMLHNPPRYVRVSTALNPFEWWEKRKDAKRGADA